MGLEIVGHEASAVSGESIPKDLQGFCKAFRFFSGRRGKLLEILR